ncbi:hypothetical protein Hanom_Chr10g00890691 [Helianthus anomalus]
MQFGRKESQKEKGVGLEIQLEKRIVRKEKGVMVFVPEILLWEERGGFLLFNCFLPSFLPNRDD